MQVTIPKEMQSIVEELVRSGTYDTVEDVICAGILMAQQAPSFGDFAPGELDAIIAKAEDSFRKHGGIPAEDVFARIREKSAKARAERSI